MADDDAAADSAAALAELRQNTTSVGAAYKAVFARGTWKTREAAKEMAADAKTLHDYDQGPGQAAVLAVTMAVPELKESKDFIAIPTEVGYCFSPRSADEKETNQIAALTAYWSLHYGNEQSITQVDAAWDWVNQCVLEKQVEAIPDAPPHKRGCRVAGICLCTPLGKQLKQFWNAFSTLCTKTYAQPYTDGRKELKDGRWAFRCVGSAAAPGPAGPAAPHPDDSIIILHVAKQSLSPWIPTWHRVLDAPAPFGNPEASDTRIYTKACDRSKFREVSLVGNSLQHKSKLLRAQTFVTT